MRDLENRFRGVRGRSIHGNKLLCRCADILHPSQAEPDLAGNALTEQHSLSPASCQLWANQGQLPQLPCTGWVLQGWNHGSSTWHWPWRQESNLFLKALSFHVALLAIPSHFKAAVLNPFLSLHHFHPASVWANPSKACSQTQLAWVNQAVPVRSTIAGIRWAKMRRKQCSGAQHTSHKLKSFSLNSYKRSLKADYFFFLFAIFYFSKINLTLSSGKGLSHG